MYLHSFLRWWTNRGMSKDLEPYEGWSWGRGASDSSLQTDVPASMEADLMDEVRGALQRAQTSELDQTRPTKLGVRAAEDEEKLEKVEL